MLSAPRLIMILCSWGVTSKRTPCKCFFTTFTDLLAIVDLLALLLFSVIVESATTIQDERIPSNSHQNCRPARAERDLDFPLTFPPLPRPDIVAICCLEKRNETKEFPHICIKTAGQRERSWT